jgi:lysozyme family protein
MEENFNRCLAFTLRWEGGYSNDPDDPGGETNFGIDKRSHPDLDIPNLTLEQAKQIYKTAYWTVCSCGNKPWPFDLIVFDTAVNMGNVKAILLYQENPVWQDYLFARIRNYVKIADKTRGKYLKGWINRVIDLYAEIKKR